MTLADVNGDGYADAIVGTPRYSPPSSSTGFSVFHGGPSGISTTAAVTIQDASTSYFAREVSGAGFVDDDPYQDVIVGKHTSGEVLVYYGSSVGLSAAAVDTVVRPASAGNSFGVALAGAGDVDGDGLGDVLIGSPSGNPTLCGNATGSAYLFRGTSSGVDTSPVTTLSGECTTFNGEFGRAVR